jgi:hypothetical protein
MDLNTKLRKTLNGGTLSPGLLIWDFNVKGGKTLNLGILTEGSILRATQNIDAGTI